MYRVIFKMSLISVMEAYSGFYPTSMVDVKVVNYFHNTDLSSMFDEVLNTPLFDPDIPVNIYMLNVNNRNTRKRCEIIIKAIKANNKNTRT